MSDSRKPLICSVIQSKLQLVEEERNGKKDFYVKGLFGRVDEETGNKRAYPRPIIEREFTKLKESIDNSRLMGELDHPFDGKTKLSRVSHLITKLELKENGEVYGEAKIFDTPNGKTLKAIADGGGQIGVSSRGFGTVKLVNGINTVQEDFRLETYDFVAKPAGRGAYPEYFMEGEGEAGAKLDLVLENIERDFPHVFDSMRNKIEQELREDIEKEYEQVAAQTKKDKKIISEDESAILQSILSTVSPLIKGDEAIGALRKKVQTLEEEKEQTYKRARLATNKLYVIETLKDSDDAALIEKELGDLSQYESSAMLEERINLLIEKHKRLDESMAEKDDELRSEREKNQKLEAGSKLTEDELELRKKLIGNPKIEEAVEKLKDGMQVEEILVKYKEAKSSNKIFEEVQSAMSRFKGARRIEVDKQITESIDRSTSEGELTEDEEEPLMSPDINILGHSVRELVELTKKVAKK